MIAFGRVAAGTKEHSVEVSALGGNDKTFTQASEGRKGQTREIQVRDITKARKYNKKDIKENEKLS